jgi:ATP-dependent RNA helicase DeaD
MTFNELGLRQETINAVKQIGFLDPTPIQKKCIPLIKLGQDIVAQSLTGSGKTAAFGIPIVEKVIPGKGIQALVLVPTRELAEQVKEAITSFSSFLRLKVISVYGGVGMAPQVAGLRTAEIVVATPGRLLDHIGRGTIQLNNINTLVLDEADKMFEMGFIDDVNEIISHLPRQRQTMLFSATIPREVNQVVSRHLTNPVSVKEQIHVDKDLLNQIYYNIQPRDKFSLLVHLLKKKTPGLAIIFCGTRSEVDVLTKNLKTQGIHAMAVHGGLSQDKRTKALDLLRQEQIDVLVATDVAARGIDVQNISHVYNYDSAKNAKEYTHRIGRTARAGNRGEAVTLLSERDYDNFRSVQSDPALQIKRAEPPEFERVPFFRQPRRDRFSQHAHHGAREFSRSGFRGQRFGRR